MNQNQGKQTNSRSRGIDISKAKYRDGAKDRGLGDTIARGIQAVTFGKVKPCPKCKERIDFLNNAVRYRAEE